jgi:hypothetical protein
VVVEVVHTSGGLDKLDVWRGLGAKEVWFWSRPGKLDVHVRRGEGFELSPRSDLVRALDLDLLVRCTRERTQAAAVRTLRAALAT